jgi:hypothetical protein
MPRSAPKPSPFEAKKWFWCMMEQVWVFERKIPNLFFLAEMEAARFLLFCKIAGGIQNTGVL